MFKTLFFSESLSLLPCPPPPKFFFPRCFLSSETHRHGRRLCFSKGVYLAISLSIHLSFAPSPRELLNPRCCLSSETHRHGRRLCFNKGVYGKLKCLKHFFLDLRPSLSLSLSPALPPPPNFYQRERTTMGYYTRALDTGSVLIRVYMTN